MVYTLRFFPLQNAVCFTILTYLVPVLITFYIQGVLKLKKKIPSYNFDCSIKQLMDNMCVFCCFLFLTDNYWFLHFKLLDYSIVLISVMRPTKSA